jgi:hypothetical protein
MTKEDMTITDEEDVSDYSPGNTRRSSFRSKLETLAMNIWFCIQKNKFCALIGAITILVIIFIIFRFQGHSDSKYCRWTFVSYEASSYEALWQTNIKSWQDNICGKLAEDEHLIASQSIIHDVEDLTSISSDFKWNEVDTRKPGYLKKDYNLMSKFHYERECYDESSAVWYKSSGKGVQLIEPLWGFLRDPFDIYCGLLFNKTTGWIGEVGQSKEHIMPQGFSPYAYTLEDNNIISPDQWHSHGIPPWHMSLNPIQHPDIHTIYEPPKRVFIDLGSSYFKFWDKTANKIAASGEWFYNIYHARGQTFDRFVQVEVDPLDPKIAWNQLPDDLVSAFTLINIPLEVDPQSKFDVSTIIKSMVKPNDFFVIKVDIDSAPIEEPFVYSLLKDDSVANYIDEMMFEHHVDVDMMRSAWGKGLPHNMADSYELFRGLRLKGIRAHSWP